MSDGKFHRAQVALRSLAARLDATDAFICRGDAAKAAVDSRGRCRNDLTGWKREKEEISWKRSKEVKRKNRQREGICPKFPPNGPRCV